MLALQRFHTSPRPVRIAYSSMCGPVAKISTEKRPVMVFLPGGGFQFGGSAQPTYDGSHLAKNGIVVVTLNYRFGVFGFLGLTGLDAEGTSSGNYGLQDQMAALKWVQQNIQASVGASSVAQLRAMSALAINAAEQWIPTTDPKVTAFSPSIDYYVLVSQPGVAFAIGLQHKIPLLAGFNGNEGALFAPYGLSERNRTKYEDGLQLYFTSRASQALALYPDSTPALLQDSATNLIGDGHPRADLYYPQLPARYAWDIGQLSLCILLYLYVPVLACCASHCRTSLRLREPGSKSPLRSKRRRAHAPGCGL